MLKDLFQGVAAVKAFAKTLVGDTCFATPFDRGLRLSIPCNETAGPSIHGLFTTSGPSAIVSAVMAVVVVSFERVLGRRAKAHVAQEGFERLTPFDRDGDSTSSIILKGWMSGIRAALVHVVPSAVFGAVGHVVRAFQGSHSFPPETATRDTVAATQGLRGLFGSGAAGTDAQPPCVLLSWDAMKHLQSSELLAR
jgi:hypothetical protein